MHCHNCFVAGFARYEASLPDNDRHSLNQYRVKYCIYIETSYDTCYYDQSGLLN